MYIKRNISAYAVAIYDLVKEQDMFEATQAQFELVKEVFDKHPEFIDYFKNDSIDEEERLKSIDDAFGGMHWIVINTLKVIVQRRMAPAIKKIIIEYLKLSNNELRIRFAKVVSAFPISDAEMDLIREKIQSVTRRRVVLKNEVDPSLIGGIKIVSKTEVLEMNILNDLTKIKNSIIKKEKEKEVL
ncbi:ATP synthase F1 subunit delta [Mycoplasma sp. Pen4]|uniref:ATP synthase F1 subunit delta n=1 Tax=Mycoplasma sp. Pen4 TaxID=640330 RepID=UPI0016540D60|nr:ATP synthase F1 subunit delta [Mycoplasma sp. Pen4]QNM93726.1 ATP synthase F1 subunit delta [Mycoplasma sp. Pen4]